MCRQSIIRLIPLLFCSALLLAACAKPVPPPEGMSVYQYLQEDEYQKWPLWPGTEAMHKSAFPHGQLVTTRVNSKAAKALRKGEWPLPEGAMVVADNFLLNQKLASITVMFKQPGSNPEGGDWYWVQYLPGGKVRLEGTPHDCINCHTVRKDNDFLYATTK